MFRKFNQTTFVAVCTSGALIAYAWDQRGEPIVTVSEIALYIGAAVVCLLPVAVALVRHGTARCPAA